MRECWVSNKQCFPLPSCAYDSRVGGICVCPSMPPTETHFLLEAMNNKKLISCAFQFLSNMFSLLKNGHGHSILREAMND